MAVMKDIPNRGPEVAAVAGLFLGLTLIFSALRLYSRAGVAKSVGADDYLAFASQIWFAGMCATTIVGVHYGIGKKTLDATSLANAPSALMWWWISELLYLLANVNLKISMGIFLLRIAIQKPVKIIIWTIVISTVVSTLYFILLFFFQCWPLNYFWTRFLQPTGGHCLSNNIVVNSTYAYSAITCVVDFTFCITPIFMVLRVQLNKRTKMSVIAIMSLWALASIATLIRIPYLKDLNAHEQTFLYDTTDLVIWSLCETGISIVTIAAATLRPLFRTFFRGSQSSTNRSRRPSNRRSGSQWPPRNGSIGTGYLRSYHNTTNEDIELNAETKRPIGVTTYIHGDNNAKSRSMDIGRSDSSQKSLNGSINEQSNADFVYGDGIRRTTVVTTERLREL